MTKTDGKIESSDDGLCIQLFSLHGLIRSHDLELGRDADTGGQTKYMVEFARALGKHPKVAQVDLFTRCIEDPKVAEDYAQGLEPLSDNARIVRIRAGGKKYIRKELLWPHLDEFVDGVLRFNRKEGITPDLVHGHYADAGYVAMELAGYLGVPLIFTGHSLGRNKLQVLTRAGLSKKEIDKQYHIDHRISVEEEVMRKSDIVIASTHHEVERGYELYDAHKSTTFKVVPPGIEVDKFYPYYHDLDEAQTPSEEQVWARVNMRREINRFLNRPEKPLILAISRPDKRKNIDGLVTAYGEDKELQSIANLAIFAGVRKDIQEMDDNERKVLTEMLLLMDKYDLYGKMALPKKHKPDTEIPALYRLAAATKGVFVNPALVENFGITVIEASSSGLPVVSTNHGGPQDILKNCNSGILVDVQNYKEISGALKKILVDGELWNCYSENGIKGVREHYSWRAHCDTYLDVISDLMREDAPQPAVKPRGRVGRYLTTIDKLFMSDIDYTLINKEDTGVQNTLVQLNKILKDKHPTLGFGVASGRSLKLVKEVLDSYDLPQPDIIVSSVGSEIYYGPEFTPDQGYAQHISYRWKPEKIREVLAELDFLELQEEANQRRFKISYYMRNENGNLETVHRVLNEAKLRYNLIYSHGQFLDVLPHRASKGKAIRYLSHKWGIPAQNIAVAGDSGNDEEMLRGNFRGIVVGNHAEELTRLKGAKHVYFADGHYAAGVLEGLKHYKFL